MRGIAGWVFVAVGVVVALALWKTRKGASALVTTAPTLDSMRGYGVAASTAPASGAASTRTASTLTLDAMRGYGSINF